MSKAKTVRISHPMFRIESLYGMHCDRVLIGAHQKRQTTRSWIPSTCLPFDIINKINSYLFPFLTHSATLTVRFAWCFTAP